MMEMTMQTTIGCNRGYRENDNEKDNGNYCQASTKIQHPTGRQHDYLEHRAPGMPPSSVFAHLPAWV